MIPNEYCQPDADYVTQQNYFVLRILDIWPSADRQPSIKEKITNILLMTICYFLLHFDTAPGVLYCVFDDAEMRHVKIKTMPPIMHSIIAFLKYSSLIIHDILHCLKHIKEDWRTMIINGARDIIINKDFITRHLFKCSIFMYFGGISYNMIVPILWGNIVTDHNVTIKSLSCPGHYIFFDPQNTPAYEIVFLQQTLYDFITYMIIEAICGLAVFFVLHACAQIKNLTKLMKDDIVDCKSRRQRNISAKLAVMIKHQIRIRDFLEHLMKNTLRYSSLVEIMGCTMILCLKEYCIIMEWEDRNPIASCSYAIALISITFNIFIFCYIGERLCDKGEKLALTVCTLDWYNLPNAKARALILIIAMSNSPMKLKAGNIITLSLRSFGDVVKTAAAYFNLLRRVMN